MSQKSKPDLIGWPALNVRYDVVYDCSWLRGHAGRLTDSWIKCMSIHGMHNVSDLVQRTNPTGDLGSNWTLPKYPLVNCTPWKRFIWFRQLLLIRTHGGTHQHALASIVNGKNRFLGITLMSGLLFVIYMIKYHSLSGHLHWSMLSYSLYCR